MRFVTDCVLDFIGAVRARGTKLRASVCWLQLLLPTASWTWPGHVEAQASSAAPQVAQWQCEDGMQDLLSRLAHVEATSAVYQEERRIALLRAPLRSHGQVFFAAPDVLLRLQAQTGGSAMLLEGNTVYLRDGERERELSLDRWEAAQGLVRGYLDVLRGDASGLERRYLTDFKCTTGSRWTLILTPRPGPLERLLQRMTLRGVGTTLLETQLVDVHGDVTTTTFTQHQQQAGGDATRKRLREQFKQYGERAPR